VPATRSLQLIERTDCTVDSDCDSPEICLESYNKCYTDCKSDEDCVKEGGECAQDQYAYMYGYKDTCAVEHEWEYLKGKEQQAAAAAFYVLFFVLLHPLGMMQIHATNPSHSSRRCSNKWSGILVAAVAVQCTVIATNTLLAWAPMVVRVDPITGARVFLLRWSEWTPLAGLIRFLAETIDLPRWNSGIRTRI
jgi:hypothetical protein